MKIRAISSGDSEAFLNLIQKNKTHLQIYLPKTVEAVYDLESSETFIRNKLLQSEKKEAYLFLVELDEVLVGMLSLKNFDWTIPKCEIAYFVDVDFQGKGIVTNTIQWGKEYCFDELKLEKIYARIAVENEASKKVVLKNGFYKEALMHKDYRNGAGILCDVEYYALLKT